MAATSVPYHEPSIVQILVLSSFGLLLNLTSWALERTIYCGLVGQILVGIFWGTPLGGFLESSIETAVVQLGYLGVILLVYEGGLSTTLRPLLHNLPLSIAVATTGILLPIALSFPLSTLLPNTTTPLQCFAAGAALSATSLGTTFGILRSSGLSHTRLGTVLASAAMLDDVVGLIMIQVVSSLGTTHSLDTATIARPVGASLGLIAIVTLICRYVVAALQQKQKQRVPLLTHGNCAFAWQTGVLLSLVTAASYAGTSVLLAAFLAGAAISWYDGLSATTTTTTTTTSSAAEEQWTGVRVYEHYFAPVNTHLLTPFFFASIGFSIPVTLLFGSGVVWRGIVYAALMALGKVLTGVWLLRINIIPWTTPVKKNTTPTTSTSEDTTATPTAAAAAGPVSTEEKPQKPISLYPPSILGLAMIARGEIGFLIASIAEAQGIFRSAGEEEAAETSELYLVVIWATVLCTVLGPVCVGLLVKRVKALEKVRVQSGEGAPSVLGSWGVDVSDSGSPPPVEVVEGRSS